MHKLKLMQVVDLICDKLIDKATGCGLNQFDLAFNSLPAISIKRTWNGERLGEQPADPVDTTSYGHNVELEYLMQMALKTAKAGGPKYEAIHKRLLDHAVKHGVDWDLRRGVPGRAAGDGRGDCAGEGVLAEQRVPGGVPGRV